MTRLLATLAALAFATVATATPGLARTDPAKFSTEQLQALQQLNTWLRGTVTLQGAFTQQAPDGSVTHGRFAMEKPGRLRFEYAAPAHLQIIADGFWVAIQDRKLDTTDKYPLATTPLKLILDNNVDLLRDADVEEVYASDELTTVVLQSTGPQAAGELALMFDPQRVTLERWSITDVQGLTTTVELDDTVANARVDDKLFNIIDERTQDIGGPNTK